MIGIFYTTINQKQKVLYGPTRFTGLVINNNAKTNNLTEQIFWYKAESRKDFKLGSREFWEMSKELNSDDEDEQYDPNNNRRKSAGPKINVKKTRW